MNYGLLKTHAKQYPIRAQKLLDLNVTNFFLIKMSIIFILNQNVTFLLDKNVTKLLLLDQNINNFLLY